MPDAKCPTPGPAILSLNKEQLKGKLWRPPCKRWSCEVCAEQNAADWGYVALYGTQKLMNDECRMAFVTITSHERLDAAAAIEVWPTAWKKLYTRITREYGKGHYMMVTEKTKRGKLHVHAVVTWHLKTRWLKDNARECGLGYQADVKPLEFAAGAAAYVSKYLTKHRYAWPRGWRRVRLSRRWPRPDEAETMPGWEHKPMLGDMTTERVRGIVYDYGSAGYDVKVADDVLGFPSPGGA